MHALIVNIQQKFKFVELHMLLDADSCQTQQDLAATSSRRKKICLFKNTIIRLSQKSPNAHCSYLIFGTKVSALLSVANINTAT